MKYKKIKYPDGQIGAEILDITYPYIVSERINSYEDLFFVMSIAEALDNLRIGNRHLFIPCLFGQRSDRRFNKTGSYDLKLIAAAINSCTFSDVEIFDPHSDVATALINRAFSRSPFEFVARAVSDEEAFVGKQITIISPDAGAYKKCFEHGQKLNREVISAVKHRNLDGSLNMEFTINVKGKHCMIVDDICDGGATFVKLGAKLKELGAERVSLYISHGMFSKGLNALRENIDHIYCTNSVADVETNDNYITQYKLI